MADYIEREDDYIKRSEMRETLKKASISTRFADMPKSADVRPERHARWSDNMVSYMDDFNGGLHIGFRCSKCKAILNKTTYCGNCGAKMDGKDNDI
ncbi:MAG: hypothetical protein K2N06_05380 [Oscillospiraceae bacterium]|nr:hypothetical protein [Oscillospiraceae bacterium]